MLSTLHKDLLMPPGRSARVPFIIALGILIASCAAMVFVTRALGNTLPVFLLGLVWTCLNVYMFYSVYARRLHDMNLSVGPWFATIFVSLLVYGFAWYAGGGGDYFDAIQANPEIQSDPVANELLIKQFQADMKANMGWVQQVMAVPFALFTLFCALKPGTGKSNKYGGPA